MSRSVHAVSPDTALRLLANPERRAVLTGLMEREEKAMKLDELVEYVAPENPPPPEPGLHATRDQLLLDLAHTHLPKLEDAGLVEFDRESGSVRYLPIEPVEKLHRFVTEEFE